VEPELCRRERLWLSQRLDGTISPFERLRLERHLARCHRCREFERHLVDVTSTLRNAPLELPSLPVLTRRPRRPALRLGAAVAAAVCAVVIAGASAPVPDFGAGRPEIVDDYVKDEPASGVYVWFPGQIG